jgi:hypothetical protein
MKTEVSPHITIEPLRGYVNTGDICRRRLAGQLLTTNGPARARDVVAALGAVQAQDYFGAKWAVAQRARGATDASVERELDEGHILRTHVLRPTWHLVLPSDIRWMLELTGPRVAAAMAPANKRLELDRDVHRRGNAVFTKALAGGNVLTRAELRTHLERARVKITSGQQLGHLMMQSELDGVVCSGPRRGKQFTYALLDERAPQMPRLSRDEALLELTRRYFLTRSPATTRDFSWWSGLTISDAKRGITLAGKDLERATLGGQEYWIAAAAPRPARSSRAVHLLPNYDEYFIGYRDRSAIADRLGHTQWVMGGNALIPHVIVASGQLVGTWRRTFEQKGTVLTLSLTARLSAAETKGVQTAVKRFSKFLGAPIQVRSERFDRMRGRDALNEKMELDA